MSLRNFLPEVQPQHQPELIIVNHALMMEIAEVVSLEQEEAHVFVKGDFAEHQYLEDNPMKAVPYKVEALVLSFIMTLAIFEAEEHVTGEFVKVFWNKK